ncbi:oxidative stress-responsive serine-rich protein 1 [Salarias fasciatus]|uniref:Oxidative stress-responsive serine-rich protein 1 n=1 Tax=Salarias fasciatus TaxID=181472 RepID=A0A672G3E4_SALFA|nr:oxidative stress-responsive serine-rich protein 1 [Salarias fasciatus]
MEAGGKDSEEDTLQMAFKKLRVDAESRSGPVGVSEASRGTPSRASLECSGSKTKLACPKDNWHGSTRKSSRGSSRTQRRRRSKSPILHPPKFTYCGGAAAPPGGCLKQQRLAVAAPPDARPPGGAGQEEPGAAAAPDRAPPPVFGSRAGLETREESGAGGPRGPAEPGDFRALCEPPGDGCSECGAGKGAGQGEGQGEGQGAGCRCRAPGGWNGVEVYSFTGLRDVMSECERPLQGPRDPRDPPRTRGSPRSCSEQARGFVDDVTIEDLSGYMEFYLYFPKKMSHMAEMMYT